MSLFYRVLEIPRIYKQLAMVLMDLLLIVGALCAGLYIRLGEQWVEWLKPELHYSVAIVLGASVFAWFNLGVYRVVVRFIDVKTLSTLVVANIFTASLLIVSGYFLKAGIPRSVPFIFFAVLVISTSGIRLLLRGLINTHRINQNNREKVIIYGAGSSGRQLCLSLRHGCEYTPVAFIDKDKHIQNTVVADVRVYSPEKLRSLVEQFKVQKILLAIPSATASQRKSIIKTVESLKVRMLTIPGSADLISGKVSVSQLRDVEIKDLLGREAVPPEAQLLEKCIKNKVVMVTGGGGSIGSELCRQIMDVGPKELIILDSSEFNLYAIEQELTKLQQAVKIVPVLGSVLDKKLVQKVIKGFEVKTIYHAAAYKHVPLVEMNSGNGVLNNVFGTKIVAQAALDNSVERFVLVSTDKAVRPTNVMGASKRLAELVIQNLASRSNKTVYSIVRFGNVLGSSGSVVPLFKKQIELGGPVTVTHQEITRYFMTIPEAATLVIQAGAMAEGGEVFVLDMGNPVKIRDLAENMIRLMGLDVKSDSNPEGDIEIKYSGLRPGEKLYEELLIGSNVEGTQHERIMKAKEISLDQERLNQVLEKTANSIESGDMASLREIFMNSKLGFSPVSEIADLLYCKTGNEQVIENITEDKVRVIK